MSPRRRCERYRLLGSALVIFERPRMFNIGKPRIIKLGPLSDISQGGLSAEYLASGKRFTDFNELSILVPGNGVTVYRIPFRNISDTVVAEPDAKRKIMRMGIQFDEPNHHHISSLKKFINLYARKEVPDRRSGFEMRTVSNPGDSFAAIPERRHDRKMDSRE